MRIDLGRRERNLDSRRLADVCMYFVHGNIEISANNYLDGDFRYQVWLAQALGIRSDCPYARVRK